MEMQRGVVGDLAALPALASAAAEAELVPAVARLLEAARGQGIPVIHCTAAFRRERVGTHRNLPLVEELLADPEYLLEGSDAAAVLPELGPRTEDLVSQRHHGISPFGGTSLDTLLRSSGREVLVAAGVSLNVGIPGLAIEAVNLGYRVVVPRDCVVGVPRDYGEQVLRHSLSAIATLTTSSELREAWR
jgi:nicotinamidase-related amidase